MTTATRKVGFALLIALALAGMLASVAYANKAFSNAKAILEPNPFNSPVPDAEGEVIINYVKGRQAWNVSGSATGLWGDRDYVVQVVLPGEPGVPGIVVTVAEFTTDSEGNASFHEGHVEGLPDDYDVVRIRPVHILPGESPGSHLIARADEDGPGELKFRGMGRGQ